MAQHSALHQSLSREAVAGIFTTSADNIALDIPGGQASARPTLVKHMSTPSYQSPLRHHRRAASTTKPVKETLNARSEYSNSEDDGTAQHRINQYIIKQEIGRGSFGAVHLAVDQYGHEYAVKEFSKSRLRRRAQSNLLRRPSARKRRGPLAAFNSPIHRQSSDDGQPNNSLDLIKEEIAIMKKLNHPNLVSLIEVLDDPDEDSLYMVMEMCKKGVVMHVGLEETADPYEDEQCRCWFRDMILGIEYLHAQGILHRDIKPDNCLITDDDVLKIVDFGVSEMFEKESEMNTAKSAGSPAFMPPELCVAKHGEVSGKAADIWSMGVTLYCLRFGKIPFEKTGMIELYESIRNDELQIADDCDPDLKDLLLKILEKDPKKRIKMMEMREHPWVARNGEDPLLSFEENTAVILEPPTEAEVNAAITGNMSRLVAVMKAVNRFKQLLFRKRPGMMEGILGQPSRMVQPPMSLRIPAALPRKSHSVDTEDRRPLESVLTSEGVHRDIDVSMDLQKLPEKMDNLAIASPDISTRYSVDHQKAPRPVDTSAHKIPQHKAATMPAISKRGQAHNPLEDTLYLYIGASADGPPPLDDSQILSESPSAIDVNVYERAYQEEVDRILRQNGRSATLYLTRRVEHNKDIRENENIFDAGLRMGEEKPKEGFARLVQKARRGMAGVDALAGKKGSEDGSEGEGEADNKQGESGDNAEAGGPERADEPRKDGDDALQREKQ